MAVTPLEVLYRDDPNKRLEVEAQLSAWNDEDLTNISEVQPESVEWLWRHRIPRGELTVIDGDPGVGKSTLGIEIAATISQGRDWCDGTPCEKGSVILFSAEDSIARTIRPRLEAAGADLTLVLANKRALTLPDDIDYIRSKVLRYAPNALIIDPFMAFLSSKVNSWKDQDIRGTIKPLQDMATELDVAIIVVRHLNKGSGGNALYRGGGSIGIIGAARAGFLVEQDPDDETVRILASTKSNLGPRPPALSFRLETVLGEVSRIKWLGESHHTAGSLLAAKDSNELERSDKEMAKEFLRDELRTGQVEAKEIKRLASQAGISERTLDRARSALGITVNRVGFGKGAQYFYRLETNREGP